MKLALIATASAAFTFVTGGLAQDAQGIKTANLRGADLDLMENHDPQSELDHFDLLPGYQANLFAAEPMLANPIHMHWDSRGRLWVACSWSYPQIKPGEVANDKIIILEDTDDDGVADKSTVFAEGLYMPTGIELANGGCYVAQTPDVFFLKDTDGDDIADVKELALTGFGIEDSHHSISAWRRGPGGWIYFQEGIFLHSQVETQFGVVRNFNGGVYQFNPRTQELRVFCSGTGGNPWGHVFDRWGQSFMVNNPRVMYLSPASGNSGEAIQVKSLISTEKQCGGELASGTHVGDDLRGQLLTGRFKSRSVVRYEFIEKGAGFSANVLKPLISSRHPNFRPVDVKMGPDGAVYVADWYNSIINHAQHDFRDPRRDHEHGRIWRISHKERPLVKKPKLEGIPVTDLVEHLSSPEDWTRHQARNELSEENPDEVVRAVESWVEGLSPELPDYDHHLVEAMWACQNVERASEVVLNRVLSAKDGRARAAGARVLRYWHPKLADPVDRIAKLAGDPFPRARMEAVLSAGYVPRAEAYAASLHALDQPGDPLIDGALAQTRKALEPYWKPEFKVGTLTFGKETHREFAEQEAGVGFSERLVSFLQSKNPSAKEISAIESQLRTVGTDREVGLILDFLARDEGTRSETVTIALLESLEQMAGGRVSKGLRRKLGRLKSLLHGGNDVEAGWAAKNMAAWSVPKAETELFGVLEDGSRGEEVRRASAVALAKLGGGEIVERLRKLSDQGDTESRYLALAGLVRADLESGILSAARLLAEDPGTVDPVPVIQSALLHRNGGAQLSAALRDVKIHPVVKERVSAFHRNSGQLPEKLARLFDTVEEAGRTLSARLLAENQEELAADVDKLGDAARGEMIFRRQAVACANCHAVGSAGPEIGPNLVAVGTAATTSYMVESILEPNAAIAEHFENKLFTLADGSVRMGVITFRSEKEVVVRDSAQGGKEVRIAAAEVVNEQPLPSLMPAGLADQLESRSEFLDLAKFLSVLGKPGEFANDESPVLRKWRVLADQSGGVIPGDEAAWVPAYSKVSGGLPAEDLKLDLGDRVFAQSYLEVQTAGSIQLVLGDDKGVTLSMDGKAVPDLGIPLEVGLGRRVLTFAIDRKMRGDKGIRVGIEASDSKVRFQPEGGV